MKMRKSGTLRKMHSRLENPVQYGISLDEKQVPLNPLIGSNTKLVFTGNIYCIECGRKTKKSFNQGYCYPCFQKLQQFFTCLIHPEKCRCEEGSCMQDHIVYLANSSGLKVGITRATQVPTRWIDQGASQALALARVRNRFQSGLLEVLIKQHIADKTNWRDMLKGIPDPIDLKHEAENILSRFGSEIDELKERYNPFGINILNGIRVVDIPYPVSSYPEKISSYNFDKEPLLEDKLLGIKGQYLIFDEGVINLRKFSGYEIELHH